MPPLIQTAGQLEQLETSTTWSGSMAGRRSLRLYNDQVHSYASIIRTQPNVRTVISFLARNLAQLGVHLFDRVTDTNRERVTGHTFNEALRHPNPLDRRLTTYRLMHRTVWDVAAFDVAFWGLLEVPALGRPVIVPLRPDRLEIKGALWPTLFTYHGSRGSRDFTPDRIVYFQGSHNLDDPLWGLPPVEALRRVIAEDTAAGEYREQFWTRGARFDGWIERPKTAPSWKVGAKDRFSADWNGAWSGHGDKAGGTPILEDDMKFHQTENADARSAQYVEARKLSREEAAALWHIDPIWVGLTGAGMAFASVVERRKALYADSLGPWVTMLEQDLQFQALPAFESDPAALDRLYVKLNTAEKVRGSTEDLADSISKLTGRPILTVNEGRALVERNDLDEGEGLALPLNTTILGGGTPALPAPTSGQGQEGRRRGSKAIGPSTDQHHALEAAHVEAARLAMVRTFSRQLAEVLAALGADDDAGLDILWDGDRWDAELNTDLFGLALNLAADYAELTAETLGFDGVEPDAWIPYLDESARIAAEQINATTVAHLTEALADDEDRGGAIRNVFVGAGAARAAQIAQTRFTSTASFTGQETAKQAGRGSKVWLVTSSNSRHAALDGETVPLGEVFSNGMAWPGDPVGGVDNTAGCTCQLGYE